MSKLIASVFEKLKANNQAAFVAYVCAGDPDFEQSLEVVHGLCEAGIDVLELGVPFSDPLADGMVNQLAAARALEAGMNVRKVVELVKKIREFSNVPIVLFTYLNPVYTYGFAKFHEDMAEAGANGVLLLDLPPDEAAVNEELAGQSSLAAIRLIAPTTPIERIATITKQAEGFIYYVSREGVTGTRQDLAADYASMVALIQSHTTVPVVVGFGISTPEQAAATAKSSDGVVIGSAIVRMVEKFGKDADIRKKIKDFVAPLVAATHLSRKS